jgi:hypothetical protein
MEKAQTFFEQVPLETVKKICEERITRAKEHSSRVDTNVENPVAKPELNNSE